MARRPFPEIPDWFADVMDSFLRPSLILRNFTVDIKRGKSVFFLSADDVVGGLVEILNLHLRSIVTSLRQSGFVLFSITLSGKAASQRNSRSGQPFSTALARSALFHPC